MLTKTSSERKVGEMGPVLTAFAAMEEIAFCLEERELVRGGIAIEFLDGDLLLPECAYTRVE